MVRSQVAVLEFSAGNMSNGRAGKKKKHEASPSATGGISSGFKLLFDAISEETASQLRQDQ